MIDLSNDQLEKLSDFFFRLGYQREYSQIFCYELFKSELLVVELSGFSFGELDKLKDLLYKLDEFTLASQVMDFVTNRYNQQLQ